MQALGRSLHGLCHDQPMASAARDGHTKKPSTAFWSAERSRDIVVVVSHREASLRSGPVVAGVRSDMDGQSGGVKKPAVIESCLLGNTYHFFGARERRPRKHNSEV